MAKEVKKTYFYERKKNALIYPDGLVTISNNYPNIN